jgi:hypothetical protein
MSKIKMIIVVILLVGGGGAGALFGLNGFYAAQTNDQVKSRLGGAEKDFVDFLRVKAFLKIQSLSQVSEDEKLLAPLGRVPSSTTDLSPEALIKALKGPHDDLVSALPALTKKTKTENLAVLSLQGHVVAKLPDKDKYWENLKGLPIVKECLGGVSRDGFYELQKGEPPIAAAAVPVRDGRGNVAGCLLSMEALGPGILKEYAERSGLQAAVFLRKQVVASTVSEEALKPLASRLDSGDIVRFADPKASAPLLVSPEDVGFAARSVQLPSGTDGMHASVILPLGDTIAPFAQAQQMLFIGIGALLVFGLLVGLLLSGKPAADREVERLRDAVTMLADGNASTLSVDSYSGMYKDLAGSIAKLVTGGTRAPAAVSPESVSDILGKPAEPPPAEAGAGGTLDFESLLGGEKKPRPEKAAPPAEPEEESPELEAPELEAPTVSAPPSFTPPKEEPAFRREPPPAAKPHAGSGPRVDVPSDLAGIFDDQDATREVEPAVPQKARPEPRPAKPAFTPSEAQFLSDFEDQDDDQITSSDYKPDATVIAQVPDELLKLSGSEAAESPASRPSAMPRPPAPVMPPPPAPPSQPPPPKAGGDESHFKEVFDQFLNTKKQCGESTAGLTLDRFAVKLRKNTTDLKTRYKCRSVKFQVYVKNGKAALKATPVK